PERSKLTQVGRALATLGIEHIVGFSPQARGRSERANGTLQGRLGNELRVADIRTVAAANRYLRDRFIPDYNASFAHAPADPTSAFVPVGRHDLNQILCHEEERVVARDNTVRLEGMLLQIDKQRGRRSCASLRVLVRRHLNGQHSVWWGPRCLGRYTGDGRLLPPRSGSTDIAAPCAIAPPGANTRVPPRHPRTNRGRRRRPASVSADRSRVKHERSDHLSTTVGHYRKISSSTRPSTEGASMPRSRAAVGATSMSRTRSRVTPALTPAPAAMQPVGMRGCAGR